MRPSRSALRPPRVAHRGVVLALAIGLLALTTLGCSSDDDARSDASVEATTSTRGAGPTTTETNGAAGPASGAAPVGPDGQPAPSLTPGPTVRPPKGSGTNPSGPPANDAAPLTSGLAAGLVDQGYSPARAGCIAAGVLETFRGDALTIAVLHLGDPTNEAIGELGPQLDALVAACPE